MEIWDRFRTILRIMRGSGLRHYALTERLQTALVERADREQRPVEEFQEELLAAGLERLKAADKLKAQWDRLSPREKEVTALTCLGYTNEQMAARMGISLWTVKGYIEQALDKFKLNSKAKLRNLLDEWDFSDWAPPVD
jgi:DNA-binding CsgD family transcriptional regulator